MQAVQTLIAATKSQRIGKRVQTHPNYEGAPSFYRSLKEQVVQVLTTGTLGNTFYVSAKQLAQEAVDVLLQAREECPEFLARALIYARREGLMKTLPVLGLVVLSGGRGKTRALFEAVFDQVICIPDDLRAFVAMCKSGGIPGRSGFGGVAVKMVRRWMARVSEYHAVKYGSAASREITLRDILRLSHPRPVDAAVAERFAWLVRGVEGLGGDPTLNSQIRALENLKRATTEDEQIHLIREGGLPYEVVLPTLKSTTPAMWEQLLYNAPYLNLLRNLVTFQRHEVFASDENVRFAVERLANARAVERSKVLPFRFFDAWQAYQRSENPDVRLADALRQALELSFVNMPSLGSSTVAIGTDVSGSMGGPISDKGSTRFIDIAGIFTGALLRRVEDRVIPLPFDTWVHTDHGLSTRDDILVSAEKIQKYCGGGTAVGAPVQHLLDCKIKVDVFIGITDQEDWAYGGRGWYSCSGSFLDLWHRYRGEVNPEAKAFLVTIAPYRDAVAPSGEEGVHFIYGWSSSVLPYITLMLETGASQVASIERMEVRLVADPNGSHPDTDEDAQMEEGEKS